jgi:hypothetical protein
MRIWLLAALLLVTGACGAYQFPGGSQSPTPATATVSGRVLAVPCAPVQKAGDTCAGRPVANFELDYVAGTSVTKAITDTGGNYTVELAPGTYAVKMKASMRVISGPLSISVAAGTSTTINYVVDSGIRVPVPQQ